MNENEYRIQVRYKKSDFSPEVAEFVRNQNNMSLTIRLLINDAIARFGTGDLVTSTYTTLQPSLNSNTDSTTEPMKNLLVQSNNIESDNSDDGKKKKTTTPSQRKQPRKAKKKEEDIDNEPKSGSDTLTDDSRNENINSDDENTSEMVAGKAIDTDIDNNDENADDYSIPSANFDPSIYG